MLFARLIAAAIFIHEALYICRDGGEYVRRCFLPTFGLQLSSRAHAAAHAALMGVCVVIAAAPALTWLYPLCLALLMLVIASYSLRLSNHLIVAWFMLLALCAAALRGPAGTVDEPFLQTAVCGVVVLAYFLAFFHKLNADYFSPEQSCAATLARFYCWDRGIRAPWLRRAVVRLGMYGTVAVEFAVPVLLLFPQTMPLGLVLAILFHFSMALLGIVNFSAVMLAGLAAFVPPASYGALAERASVLGAPGAALIALAFAACVVVCTARHASELLPYRMRAPAWVVQLVYGEATAIALVAAVALATVPHAGAFAGWSGLDGAGRAIVAVLWAAFLLNGIAPYLGLKTEFSLAMFSNLRAEPWRHLIVPAAWRPFRPDVYVRVEAVDGLPEASRVGGDAAAQLALRVLSQPSQFRYSRYFLHEAVRRIAAAGVCTISVRYTDGATLRELRWGSPDVSPKLSPWSRLVLFPFVLPNDPGAAHSEQGSIVDASARKQLF
jgi:hypothetical protein